MDVAAILMVASGQPVNAEDPTGLGLFAGVPFPVLDVLGRSPVLAIADALRNCGVQPSTLIVERRVYQLPELRHLSHPGVTWVQSETGTLNRTTEEVFNNYCNQGAEFVLVLRLGPYTELDYGDLLRHHFVKRQHVTVVNDVHGPLQIAVVNSNRRNDLAFLLRSSFAETRLASDRYIYSGYLNRLDNPSDLRNLARDGLLMRCNLRPAAEEVKPGVWIGRNVRLHQNARVLAPTFIGDHVKLRRSAVVTRCSSLEHHAEIGHETVVEDSSVMPYCCVGSGLDVDHAVVGFRHFAHLRRGVTVEITDGRLISMAQASAPRRTLESAASLATYVPGQLLRGFRDAFRPKSENKTTHAELPENFKPSVRPRVAGPASDMDELTGSFAIARDYGEQ